MKADIWTLGVSLKSQDVLIPKSLPLLAFNNQKSSTGPQENKLRGETIFGTGEVFISFKLSEF